MSRIGRRPIELPSGVTVEVSPGGTVNVKGPLGELQQQVPARIQIAQEDGVLNVTRPTDRGDDRALHGLTRTLVANMVEGVTKGFEKHLEIQGVGYRAQLKGNDLELAVGYSHTVTIAPREGVTGKLVLDSLPAHVRAGWAPSLDDAATLALSWARPRDLVITFGVGEPWKIARAIVDGLPE